MMADEKPARRLTYTALLKVADVADLLGMSEGSVYNLVYERKIPTVKIGRRVRFRLGSIERFIEKRERKVIE